MNTLLAEIGEALYGSRWRTELARDLGVVDRTVRRWAAGEQDMPPAARAELLRLTQERAGLLDSLAGRLREVG